MARFSAGVLTGAGSTTLPIISIYSAAAVVARIAEIAVFNTTATALALKVIRLTTTGTQGVVLSLAENKGNQPTPANCQVFTTHTANPALGNDLGYRTQLGAAIGSGMVWTFPQGLETIVGVAKGIGVLVENGTGQICQAYIAWDE